MFKARWVNDVEDEMRRTGVSPEGIGIMRTKGKFLKIRLDDVPLRDALLLKQEALAAGMECSLPYCAASLRCAAPSAILFGTEKRFRILIDKMREQPFNGKLIANEIEECIENYRRRGYEIIAGKHRIKIPPVRVMGVLNVTPDSFSDGGKYLSADRAISRAEEMIKEGVDIIDVGGESSRPFAEPVSEEEELKRIIPVIESIVDLKIPISVDTYKPGVAEEALKRGASMVNDIFAMRMDGMAEVVREYDAAVILMHMKGEPRSMQVNPHYDDTITEIYRFLHQRVEYAKSRGIEDDRIIIDPGIGFGKRVEDNLKIIENLNVFRSMGYPILIGASRKSFIGEILDLDVNERLEGTIASNVVAVMNGVSIIRVHDVKENLRAVRMASAIMEVKI